MHSTVQNSSYRPLVKKRKICVSYFSVRNFKTLACTVTKFKTRGIKNCDEQMDAMTPCPPRLPRRTDKRTSQKAICPINFFKAGGKKNLANFFGNTFYCSKLWLPASGQTAKLWLQASGQTANLPFYTRSVLVYSKKNLNISEA